MAKQTINIGSGELAGDGESIRSAFDKINDNFDELYTNGGGGAGVTGPQGPSGVDGAVGPTGPAGTGISTSDTAPVYPEIGDLWYDTVSGRTYIYYDSGWVDASPPALGVQGPTGPQGPSGVDGAVGPTGPQGDPGVAGPVGPSNFTSISSHILPSEDLTYDLGSTSSQWRSLYVGTSTVYFGGIPLSITPAGGITVNDQPIAVGSVQPYLELTNTPLIVQPAVLDTPVTITVPNSGVGGQIDFTILLGPTIDINDVSVSVPGTGYVVGQRYKIWYYDIGGSNPDANVEFTVATVGEAGELLTVTDFAFAGGLADNVADTYLNRSFQLQAWIFDEIDTGLTLARDGNQGIYNIEQESEYDNNTYLSPLGTEWNSDGWGTLLELGTRTYTTWRQALNNQVGNNIIASELIMRDTVNDRYYKFDFTAWNGNNGGYSYTRTEITDPNYFRKPHGAEAADVVVEDDPVGTGVVIARTDNTGIYNIVQEEGFSNATSPLGTTWNADGWNDLTDLTARTYTSFDEAANGYDNVLGQKFVMYVASIEKYYAIEFYEWATNGDNNFAYVRYEIDQTKLNEGVRFPDGTVLKSAEGVGRVKSTAAGNRRIEEVTGYNQVSVTSITRGTTQGTTILDTRTSTDFYVVADENLNFLYNNPDTFRYLEFSFDGGNTWIPSYIGGGTPSVNYQMLYQDGISRQVTGDEVVAYRTVTGGEPAVWWDKADLPGGSQYFRGAVIDYHAYTGESTIIGTIHIIDDDGENHISHQEVQSGSTDGENDDLWLVTQEGQIRYRRIDSESKTLKIHWTAKVFYGQELYD